MDIKEAEGRVKALEARRDELRTRIDVLTDEERQTMRQIGAAIASGDIPSARLRKARQDARDGLEDMVSALPFVEREIAEAQEALRRARVAEAQAEVRQVEAKAEAWGEALQKLLAPVVARLAEIPAMQAEFDRTRSVVHRLTNVTDGGRLNQRITEFSGFGTSFLRDLKSICERLEV